MAKKIAGWSGYVIGKIDKKQLPAKTIGNANTAKKTSGGVSILRRASESVFYGQGEWDKVPYTVEVMVHAVGDDLDECSRIASEKSSKILADEIDNTITLIRQIYANRFE